MKGITFNIGELEDWKNRIGEWSDRNFLLPGYEPREQGASRLRMRQALGMVEEYGELQNAVTENDTAESRYAVVDIMIYSLDLTHTCGFKITDIVSSVVTPSIYEDTILRMRDEPYATANNFIFTGLAIYLGKLCHAVLKWEQGIMMSEDHPKQICLSLCHIWRMLYRYCQYRDWDFNTLVVDTAKDVTQRDWVKSPDTAHLEVK